MKFPLFYKIEKKAPLLLLALALIFFSGSTMLETENFRGFQHQFVRHLSSN
jgi:hypothetical protein